MGYKYRKAFLFLFLLLLPLFLLPAQEAETEDGTEAEIEIDEDALFGGSDDEGSLDDDLFGSSEDDLFGGDGGDSLIEDIAETEDGGTEAYLDFLTSDEIRIGGSYSASMASYWSWQNPAEGDADELLLLDLGASVFLDARPSSNFRVFSRANLEYPFTLGTEVSVPVPPGTTNPDGSMAVARRTTVNTLNASIFELYSDINLDQTLFLRFGKQTINWGVGRFWSPADFISLTPIDPEKPESQREGPVALKATLPFGLNEIDAYVIADESVRKLEDLGYAVRGNFFFDVGDGGFETQLGLGYQKDRPLRLMTTVRIPLSGVSIFLEGRLSFGRQGQKIVSAGNIQEDDDAYFSGTAGLNFRESNLFESTVDLSILGQYYFQGEGYDDSSLLSTALARFNNGIHRSTIENFGKHYTGLSLSLGQLFLEDLSISSFWVSNWSDLSGTINTGISYRFFDRFVLTFSVINSYGDDDSEYGTTYGPLTGKNRFGKLAFAVTLNVGSGTF